MQNNNYAKLNKMALREIFRAAWQPINNIKICI